MAGILYESYYGISGLNETYLEHRGTKGMRWGIRRYQYEDGSLTPAGRARYLKGGAMAEGIKYSSQRKKALAKKGTWYERQNGNSEPDRSGKMDKANELLRKATERNIKNGKDKPNISAAESITRNVVSGIESASRLTRAYRDYKESQKPKDFSRMSDEELIKAISRLNMERQYRSLSESQSVSTGYEKALSILSMSGEVLGVAGAGLGIALTVKELRGK